MPGPQTEEPLNWGWFQRTFNPFLGQQRFATYGSGGLLDPKNYTIEPYAYSGGGSAAFWRWDRARWGTFGMGFIASQAVAFLGVGLIGMIFDPLGIDDDAGMDEIWGDVFDWGVPRHPIDDASSWYEDWHGLDEYLLG